MFHLLNKHFVRLQNNFSIVGGLDFVSIFLEDVQPDNL